MAVANGVDVADEARAEELLHEVGARSVAALRVASDVALLAELRALNPAAMGELIRRCRPGLARYAKRIGVPRGEREVLADEVLDDAVLRLIQPGAPAPRQLASYVARMLRNRYANQLRADGRRDQRHASRVTDGGAIGDVAVAAVVSEHAIRTAGRDTSEDAGALLVARLGRQLMRELGEQDRELLGWVAEGVPNREIASWIGSTYDATKRRVSRLRVRARARALEIIEGWPRVHRRLLERTLRVELEPRTTVAESDR